MEIKDYQKSLLSICSHALFSECVIEPSLDAAVIDEAAKQTVLSLITGDLKDNSKAKFKALNIAAKNMLIKNEHILLDKIMREATIPYVVLKGCASSAYYPEPILRTMGDVDFLVAPSDVVRACDALEKNGFTTNSKKTGLHYSYTKGNSVFELHFGINGIPKSEQGDIIKSYFTDIFEKSVQCAEGFMVPSHFHHGLIILLHMVSHLVSEGFGLRHLCDWAVFVSDFQENEFVEMFKEPLINVGLWKAAKLMTACSVKYLGAPNKEFAEDIDDELIDALIEDIFTGGNFGYKQEGRSQQIKFIGERENRTVNNKTVMEQLFSTVNYKAKNTRIVRKSSLLLPLGWCEVALKYFILLFKGERNINNFSENIKTAKVRKRTYSKIELFKTNK